MKKEVFVSKHSGQCKGVRRAVKMAEDLAASGETVTCLGPLLHNNQELSRLAALGVMQAESLDEVSEGTVLIRAHGASPDIVSAIKGRGLKAADATCPCVSRIAAMLSKWRAEGKNIVLVGLAGHPEVKGLAGWAVDCAIVASAEEAARLPRGESACVAAQTTTPPELYAEICDALRSRFLAVEVVDTICRATGDRQREAAELAAKCDVMFVVGSPESANTRHLLQTVSNRCARAYALNTAEDIRPHMLKNARAVGITAGASTPDWVIKEVVTSMSDFDRTDKVEATEAAVSAEQGIDEAQQPAQEAEQPTVEPVEETAAEPAAESFMEAFEKTLVTIKPGHSVTGTIVQIAEDEVCVNIGYKSDGVVPKAELTADISTLSVGDEIEVEVVKVNDGEGNVLLSQRNIIIKRNWEELLGCFERNEYVEGVGKEVVKGGLIAHVRSVRTFIPASQLSERYVEKIEQFIGQTMRLKIIEADRAKRRLVASRKQVIQEEQESKKKTAWSALEEGAVIKGVVRRITDFGAFVDVGGVDGLIHITDLSWGRVKHTSDVVRIGDEVDVKILSLDREKERIGLGLKQTRPHPWEVAPQNYPVGAIFSGKVVRITAFGAFIELEPGLDGLVHISQISHDRINRVEDVLEVGQIINVKVLEVNADNKRISLSIRQAYEDLEAYEEDAVQAEEDAQAEEADQAEEVAQPEEAAQAEEVAQAEAEVATEAAPEAE